MRSLQECDKQEKHTKPHIHSFPTRRSSDLRAELKDDATLAAACTPIPCAVRTALSASSANLSSPPCSARDRKSTRLNSSHVESSYAVFCLKEKLNFLDESPERKHSCIEISR